MSSYKTIRVKTKRGYILNAFENDSITQEIQKKGEYETNTLDSLADILSIIKPRTSLDIGANIGNHAIIIAGFSLSLVSFEPVTFIYQVLKENFILNNIVNAKAENVGLSFGEAMTDIFVSLEGNLGSSSVEKSGVLSEPVKIKIMRGDDYINNNNIRDVDFIKIDVEGHEASVLLGLENTIKASQPLILLEWNNNNTQNGFEKHDLFNHVFKGYTVYSLSYTYSKKIHKKSLIGFFNRMYFKIFKPKWCLSNFNPNNRYSNVYFVPQRYTDIFRAL